MSTTPSARRMRVVYLNHHGKLSGGEIALLRLLPHLDQVDPHVILAEDGPLRARLETAGITVEILPMPAGAREVRKDTVRMRSGLVGPGVETLRYAAQLARRLREIRPDLVHTNSLKSGVYGSLAARRAAVPVVWHVRDRIASDYLPGPAVLGLRMMLRRLPDAVLVNSRSTMATVGKSSPVVVHSVIPELIDVSAVPRADDGAFRIGIVGRLAPWKGQDIFIRAFAQAFGSGNERAAIIGSAMFGEDDFADALLELATELGVADRVEFRAFREDIQAELGRLDVLVHASRSAEPFGQVILEGLAAGLPVVAAAGGGPSEILTHGINGLLVESGDVSAFTAALRQLRDDSDLRARLREAGLRRAADFSPQTARDLVHDVYRQVLAARSWRQRKASRS